jgi:hypothetical protein
MLRQLVTAFIGDEDVSHSHSQMPRIGIEAVRHNLFPN